MRDDPLNQLLEMLRMTSEILTTIANEWPLMRGNSRRQFLVQLGGLGTTATLAGCTGNFNSETPPTTTTTTEPGGCPPEADICIYNNSDVSQSIQLTVTDRTANKNVLETEVESPPKEYATVSNPAFHPSEKREYQLRASLELSDAEHSKLTRPFSVGEQTGFNSVYIGVTLCGGLYWQIRSEDSSQASSTKN